MFILDLIVVDICIPVKCRDCLSMHIFHCCEPWFKQIMLCRLSLIILNNDIGIFCKCEQKSTILNIYSKQLKAKENHIYPLKLQAKPDHQRTVAKQQKSTTPNIYSKQLKTQENHKYPRKLQAKTDHQQTVAKPPSLFCIVIDVETYKWHDEY